MYEFLYLEQNSDSTLSVFENAIQWVSNVQQKFIQDSKTIRETNLLIQMLEMELCRLCYSTVTYIYLQLGGMTDCC